MTSMEWINIKDRLPELGIIVALMDFNRYRNDGDVEVNNPNVVQAGYLNHFGSDYWSVYGERGLEVDAFTHWMLLPDPPKEEQDGKG